MVTSPFLRCIETSLAMLEEMDTPLFDGTLYVSYGLGEYYKDNWFTRDVLDDLTYYQHSIDTPVRMAEVPYPQVRQEYPESTPEFFGRYSENYKALKSFYFQHALPKNYALVLVTHGFGIHALYAFERVFNFAEHVHYCSISAFKVHPDRKHKLELLVRNNADHCPRPKL